LAPPAALERLLGAFAGLVARLAALARAVELAELARARSDQANF